MVAATSDSPRLDLIHKLLARALDPSALDGEAETSAVKMVTVARREHITLPRFEEWVASRHKALPAPTRHEPAACSITMPFGKFRGRSMGWLAQYQPSYLRWCSEELDDEFLRDAAETVRDFFSGRDV